MSNPDLYPNMGEAALRRYFQDNGLAGYYPNHGSGVYDTEAGGAAWDIESATHVGSVNVGANAPYVSGVWFSPDGTKMFVASYTNDAVVGYTLSTAWDLSTTTVGTSLSVTVDETSLMDLALSDDGTNLYIVGFGSDEVIHYSLSTPWDVSTATFVAALTTSPELSPRGLTVTTDGALIHVVGVFEDTVYQLSLSTAWDLSTASAGGTFALPVELGDPNGLSFSPDGTILLLTNTSATLARFDLGTAYDLTTAALTSTVDLSGSGITSIQGVFASPDGAFIFIANGSGNNVHRFDLG